MISDGEIMSLLCIEEVSVLDDNWYCIVNELFSCVGIVINGFVLVDICVKNFDFFKCVL